MQSPLQMVGLYLAWVETALGGALWAIRDLNEWPRTLLIVTMSGVALIYAGVVGFVPIYLTLKKPHLLFNPSDYSPEVQQHLFEGSTIDVTNPPDRVVQP